METLLGLDGAYVDDIYYCPHHPDKGFEGEIESLKIKCDCRKPNTGLIDKAVIEHNIDLSKSYMIGDTTSDIKLAENAGIKGILLRTGEAGKDNKWEVEPDFIADNLNEALKYIKLD